MIENGKILMYMSAAFIEGVNESAIQVFIM
jgi:hypothetical protein